MRRGVEAQVVSRMRTILALILLSAVVIALIGLQLASRPTNSHVASIPPGAQSSALTTADADRSRSSRNVNRNKKDKAKAGNAVGAQEEPTSKPAEAKPAPVENAGQKKRNRNRRSKAKAGAVAAAQAEPLIGRLLSRMRRDERAPGYQHLFFKHIRKAGGTSMYSYLAKVLLHIQGQASRDNTNPPLLYTTQEFGAMDRNCPQIDPRWNRTLSIIAMRHPVERQLSEFFYSGPGKPSRSKELPELYLRGLQSGNFTPRFFDLVRQENPLWIEAGAVYNPNNLGRRFVPHFQTVALAGNAINVPSTDITIKRSKCQPYVIGEKNRKPFPVKNEKCKDNKECRGGCDKGPCQYGGGYGGGVKLIRNVTEKDQLAAIRVLESFDVVLVTEHMQESQQAAFVADVLGVPISVASLARAQENVRVTQGRHKLALLGMYRDAIPETMRLLEHHSQYEVDLYQRAVEINAKLLKQWKREKKQLSNS